MKERIVYNGKIYTLTERKVIKYNGQCYLSNSNWVRVGKNVAYRPLKMFDLVDKNIEEIN
ncbi:MAG: hypothetical protein WBA74_16355 [Cyclobacteriaceae bacterium]